MAEKILNPKVTCFYLLKFWWTFSAPLSKFMVKQKKNCSLYNILYGIFVMEWMFVPPSPIHMLKVSSQCNGFEGGALMNGSGSCIRVLRAGSISLHHVNIQLEVGNLQPGRGICHQNQHGAGSLISNFQPPEL